MDTVASGSEEFVFAIFGEALLLAIPRNSAIKPTWILIDSQSTIDIFSNPNLVRNIRLAEVPMTVRSHGGTKTVTHIADLPGYDNPVYFDEDGIANILSLAKVKEGHRVTYDSEDGNVFTVHTSNGPVNFQECGRGLYYFDQSQDENIFNIDTVETKKEEYTRRQFLDVLC